MQKKIAIALLIMSMVFLTACGKLSEKVTQTSTDIEIGTRFDASSYFDCEDGITVSLKDGSTVDTSKLGDVSADFIISNGKKEEEVPFTFKIVDTTPPVINAMDITMYAGTELETEGYVTCTDNSGEEITATIKTNNVDTSTAGTYTIVYEAADSSGNSAEKTANVEVVAIETLDDVADFVDEYLTKNGYSDFKYGEDTYGGNTYGDVVITGPDLSDLSLNADRTLSIYPEIFIMTDFFTGKYYVASIILRMTFKDTGEISSRYVLYSDVLNINSGADTISIIYDGLISHHELESSYYLSPFNYDIKTDDFEKFSAMVDSGSMTFDIEAKTPKTDFSSYPYTTTYSTFPITYELNESDLEILRETCQICADMISVLGVYGAD